MRFCYYCGRAMFTSNFSVWIKKKNYPAHKVCIERQEMKPDKPKYEKMLKEEMLKYGNKMKPDKRNEVCKCGHKKNAHAHSKGECYTIKRIKGGHYQCICKEYKRQDISK